MTLSGSVTTIGAAAFDNCLNLAAIMIPGSVTNIGTAAFQYCSSLTNVSLPGSITSIGAIAFRFCTSLTSFTIPASVKTLGNEAFYGCAKLEAITVDSANAYYSSLDGILFNKSQTSLLQCPPAKAGAYAIPASVTSIGYEAFYNCTSLTGVTIPDNLTNIATYAFYNCTSLTNIVIPASVANIESFAFYNCAKLTGVFFNGNAPSVDAAVFGGTSAIIYYLPGTTGWAAIFASRPTSLWNPALQTSGLGLSPAGFNFNITGTTNIPILVQASTNFAPHGVWVTLRSLSLTNGSLYFADPDATNYPARFYRIRSP